MQDRSGAILITGASAGLGAEYARQFAASDSRHLLLVARRHERLEALRAELGERALVFACDLRQRSERDRLLREIESKKLRIEVLVNNAGFGSLGPFGDSDVDWELDMVELNVKAPLHLCRALLPALEASPGGTIVNVCSTAAFQPMPYMATYGATKSFLLSFSLALSAELGERVRIIAQCPGPTKTEFHLVVGLPEKLAFLPSATAESVVAEAIARIRKARSGILVHGWGNAALAQLNRLFSRRTAARIVERVLRAAIG